MTEIIFQAPNEQTLIDNAKELGFVDDNDNIITNGTFESGGSWFLNIVGTIYEPVTVTDPETPPAPVAREGYWGRLRINGDVNLPSFSEDIVQYHWNQEEEAWVSQTEELAPEWINDIGIIA